MASWEESERRSEAENALGAAGIEGKDMLTFIETAMVRAHSRPPMRGMCTPLLRV